MTTLSSTVSIARLVNRHLSDLVSEARASGVDLEDLTIELAAHANCAALSFWSAEDLHNLLDAAIAEADPSLSTNLENLTPIGQA